MVFQPMLELLEYLRANGFKTYIVSGGGIEFMRAWVEGVYGVPPEQVIGSSVKTRFALRNGPVLERLPAEQKSSNKGYGGRKSRQKDAFSTYRDVMRTLLTSKEVKVCMSQTFCK
jgi:hypothetical protein